MAKKRVLLSIDEDAAALLGTLASKRKKGELVSNLIRQAASTPETGESAGILERIEQRMIRIERLLAELVGEES